MSTQKENLNLTQIHKGEIKGKEEQQLSPNLPENEEHAALLASKITEIAQEQIKSSETLLDKLVNGILEQSKKPPTNKIKEALQSLKERKEKIFNNFLTKINSIIGNNKENLSTSEKVEEALKNLVGFSNNKPEIATKLDECGFFNLDHGTQLFLLKKVSQLAADRARTYAAENRLKEIDSLNKSLENKSFLNKLVSKETYEKAFKSNLFRQVVITSTEDEARKKVVESEEEIQINLENLAALTNSFLESGIVIEDEKTKYAGRESQVKDPESKKFVTSFNSFAEEFTSKKEIITYGESELLEGMLEKFREIIEVELKNNGEDVTSFEFAEKVQNRIDAVKQALYVERLRNIKGAPEDLDALKASRFGGPLLKGIMRTLASRGSLAAYGFAGKSIGSLALVGAGVGATMAPLLVGGAAAAIIGGYMGRKRVKEDYNERVLAERESSFKVSAATKEIHGKESFTGHIGRLKYLQRMITSSEEAKKTILELDPHAFDNLDKHQEDEKIRARQYEAYEQLKRRLKAVEFLSESNRIDFGETPNEYLKNATVFLEEMSKAKFLLSMNEKDFEKNTALKEKIEKKKIEDVAKNILLLRSIRRKVAEKFKQYSNIDLQSMSKEEYDAFLKDNHYKPFYDLFWDESAKESKSELEQLMESKEYLDILEDITLNTSQDIADKFKKVIGEEKLDIQQKKAMTVGALCGAGFFGAGALVREALDYFGFQANIVPVKSAQLIENDSTAAKNNSSIVNSDSTLTNSDSTFARIENSDSTFARIENSDSTFARIDSDSTLTNSDSTLTNSDSTFARIDSDSIAMDDPAINPPETPQPLPDSSIHLGEGVSHALYRMKCSDLQNWLVSEKTPTINDEIIQKAYNQIKSLPSDTQNQIIATLEKLSKLQGDELVSESNSPTLNPEIKSFLLGYVKSLDFHNRSFKVLEGDKLDFEKTKDGNWEIVIQRGDTKIKLDQISQSNDATSSGLEHHNEEFEDEEFEDEEIIDTDIDLKKLKLSNYQKELEEQFKTSIDNAFNEAKASIIKDSDNFFSSVNQNSQDPLVNEVQKQTVESTTTTQISNPSPSPTRNEIEGLTFDDGSRLMDETVAQKNEHSIEGLTFDDGSRLMDETVAQKNEVSTVSEPINFEQVTKAKLYVIRKNPYGEITTITADTPQSSHEYLVPKNIKDPVVLSIANQKAKELNWALSALDNAGKNKNYDNYIAIKNYIENKLESDSQYINKNLATDTLNYIDKKYTTSSASEVKSSPPVDEQSEKVSTHTPTGVHIETRSFENASYLKTTSQMNDQESISTSENVQKKYFNVVNIEGKQKISLNLDVDMSKDKLFAKSNTTLSESLKYLYSEKREALSPVIQSEVKHRFENIVRLAAAIKEAKDSNDADLQVVALNALEEELKALRKLNIDTSEFKGLGYKDDIPTSLQVIAESIKDKAVSRAAHDLIEHPPSSLKNPKNLAIQTDRILGNLRGKSLEPVYASDIAPTLGAWIYQMNELSTNRTLWENDFSDDFGNSAWEKFKKMESLIEKKQWSKEDSRIGKLLQNFHEKNISSIKKSLKDILPKETDSIEFRNIGGKYPITTRLETRAKVIEDYLNEYSKYLTPKDKRELAILLDETATILNKKQVPGVQLRDVIELENKTVASRLANLSRKLHSTEKPHAHEIGSVIDEQKKSNSKY